MALTNELDLNSVEKDRREAVDRKSVLMLFLDPPSPPPLDLSSTKRNLPFFLENLKRYRVSVLAHGSQDEEDRFRKEYGDRCEYVKFVNIRPPKLVRLLRHFWLLITGRSQARTRAYGRKMQKALDDVFAKKHFDIIHCTSSLLGYYNFPQNIPLVGDTHNVEYDLVGRIFRTTKDPFMKLYSGIEYSRLKKEELAICQKFDTLLATTDRDAELWKRDLPDKNVTVIENGVDKIFFERIRNVELEPSSMVFVGHLKYYPNRHGIRYFMDEILPLIISRRPGAKLYVLGPTPTKDVLAYSSEKVRITGFVDDIRPYVAKCKAFVIPLLMGGGIRGKALEAMAMKVPIVSTSVGIEGIKLVNDESALIADTPEGFADAVVRLFDDAGLREKLTENAFEAVTTHYNWNIKGDKLDQSYHVLLKSFKMNR